MTVLLVLLGFIAVHQVNSTSNLCIISPKYNQGLLSPQDLVLLDTIALQEPQRVHSWSKVQPGVLAP